MLSPVLFALAGLLAAGTQQASAGLRLTLKTAVVADLQPGYDPDTVVLSPDGNRHAYIVKRGGRQWAVVDGQLGEAFDEVAQGGLVFSPDSRRFGCIVREGRFMRRILDGKPGPAYDRVAELVFSPDSEHTAYIATKNDASAVVRGLALSRVIVDGTGGSEYAAIQGLTFQPGTVNPVYIGLEYGSRDTTFGKTKVRGAGLRVVVGKKEGKLYQGVSSVVFSPDGKRYAYPAKRSDGSWCMVVDGREQGSYDRVQRPVFASTGRLGFACARDGKWRMNLDGNETREFDNPVLSDGFMFSPDGKRSAYLGQRGDTPFVVVDGVEAEGEGIIAETAAFTQDSKHFIYLRRDPAGPITTVFDGRDLGSVEMVTDYGPVLSSGANVAFRVEQPMGYGLVVLNGVPGHRFLGTGTPGFSPDGKYLVYAAGMGTHWMLACEALGGQPDGRALEGQLGEPLGEGRPFFTTPNRFHLLFLQKEQVVRVEGEIKQ